MADETPEEGNAPAPVEAVAVTGRPADVPSPNTTFADRAAAQSKAVSSDASNVEDKAVKKTPARKK